MIRANTVLPARREDIELHTADGLTLVGELALPEHREPRGDPRDPGHPLPTHGGSGLARATARRPTACRRWPTSRCCGSTREGRRARGAPAGRVRRRDAERYDVAAAIELAEFRELPHPWLVGLELRHRPGPHARLRPGGGGRDPAQPAAAVLRPRAPEAVGRLGQAPSWRWCPSSTTTCAPPRPASGSPRSRRPRWSPSRTASTCGSVSRTCGGRSTRSSLAWRRGARRCRTPGTARSARRCTTD